MFRQRAATHFAWVRKWTASDIARLCLRISGHSARQRSTAHGRLVEPFCVSSARMKHWSQRKRSGRGQTPRLCTETPGTRTSVQSFFDTLGTSIETASWRKLTAAERSRAPPVQIRSCYRSVRRTTTKPSTDITFEPTDEAHMHTHSQLQSQSQSQPHQ